jgi:hypothetical protein
MFYYADVHVLFHCCISVEYTETGVYGLTVCFLFSLFVSEFIP